jgi:hypothetical protein
MDIKFLFLLGATLVLWLFTRLAKKRKGFHSFLVVIFSIFITLVLIETAYRFFLKKNAFTLKSNKNFGTYAQHPLTGYMIADAGETEMAKISIGGDTIYNTSYNLIPDTGVGNIQLNHRAAFFNPNNDSSELVFLGCSITFGEGIADRETFAYKTGELCNTSSINYGLSGYGTHQAFNIYMNRFTRLNDQKHRTYIYSFIPDHILRAKCIYPWNINDPYFELSGDSIELKGKANQFSSPAKAHRLFKYLSLYNSFTFITDMSTSIIAGNAVKKLNGDDYTRVFRMIKKMQEKASAKSDKLIVVYWDKYKWKEADDSKILDRSLIEKNMDALKAAGVIVIKASEAFDINNEKFFIKGDGHPTAEANRLLSERIASEICH